jgi:hypothetical protein
VYQGWTGTVDGRDYDTERVWGKLSPLVGIDGDLERLRSKQQHLASIVHSALYMTGTESAVLLDICGRRVMSLQPGENDIRHLAPGIYCLRSADSGMRSAVRKVVIQH